MPSKGVGTDPGRAESSSFTPSPRLMFRVRFGSHKLYQSPNDLGRRHLPVSQKVDADELHKEGIALPPELVVTGNSFPEGQKKTKTHGQPPP